MQPALQKKLDKCGSLATLPALAMRVLSLCQEENLDLGQIAKALGSDPALSIKVLKMANSPLIGPRHPIKTVSHAVALLGVNTVRTVALSFSLVGHLKKGLGTSSDPYGYWRRSMVSALAADELARLMRTAHPEEAFLAALLQDVGMLALGQSLGTAYGDIVAKANGDHGKLVELERAELGADHGEVGVWLLSKWKLPDALIQCVAHSHDEAYGGEGESAEMIRTAALSGWIADVWLAPETPRATEVAHRRSATLCRLDEAQLAGLLGRVALAMSGDVARLFEFDASDIGSADELAGILDQAKEALMLASVKAEREAEAAIQSATALELQNRTLQEEAQRDKLTRVWNRARLDTYMEQEFRAAVRDGFPLSVLFCDVDHFKKVNDTYGHPIGDKVLVRVAEILGDRLRQRDLVARYGGEEFIMLLPNTPAPGAKVVAERIREKIAATKLDLDGGGTTGITISIGTATLTRPNDFESPATLIYAADQALYEAKRSGRNCVVSARPRESSARLQIARDLIRANSR
jgi:diguanylate cyclase (GGDEF)-like protein